MAKNVYFKVDQTTLDSSDSFQGSDGKEYEMCEPEEANLISSMLTNMKHSLLLDIDIPGATLTPSSTAGNTHLSIPVEANWERIKAALWALHYCGVLEYGFVQASIERGFTALRHNVTKPSKEAVSA